MFDAKSNSSFGLSIGSVVESANLNPLASIHPAVLSKIKKEVQAYEGTAGRCTAIWEALKKNDIAGAQLSEKVIEVVFKQFESDLYQFTRIASLKEFMQIFDMDRDGVLNEDEQIRIFSFIKERMELIANNALKIQMYAAFKSLMREVRHLEANITRWQEHLRERIHQQQLGTYKKIGEERVDEFCTEFDGEFDKLARLKLERKETFEREAMLESERLEEKLSQATQSLKIKPKKKIRQLQVQQKLVSLEERVEEALDFRRELNELEVSEKARVDKLLLENAEHQRQNLRKKHQKGRRELEIKLQELEFKLIIRMKKEFDILQKKNHLHENEITRIQALSAKWAIRKGTFEPELKRTKNLERRRNEILSDYKRVAKRTDLEDVRVDDEPGVTQSQKSHKQSRFNTNNILSGTVNFEITKKSQAELPVNKTSMQLRNVTTSKLSKFLEPKKTERVISLCNLYDENLNRLTQMPALNANLERAEQQRRRNFIMSKIF